MNVTTKVAAAPAEAMPSDPLPSFSHKQIVRVLTGIMLCILLAAIDQTVVIPAVPAIAADLNGFGHLSWIISAYLLTSTVATPIYGKLSDIYGRRPLLIGSITVFLVASALCALSQSLLQLILFRALQGLGGGGLMAISQAAIADVVAPRERGRYLGYTAGMWGIASVAGPILGGYLTDHVSWHAIFWINLPIGAVAMFLSNRALKTLKHRPRAARIDYLGAALLSAVITLILLVLSWGGGEYAWTSPVILGLLVVAGGLIPVLIWAERRADDPLLPPRLFANSVFTRGVIAASLAAGGLFGGTFLLPLFFQLVRGEDAASSGLMITPFLTVNTIGAIVSGQLARRLGRAKVILLSGFATATVGFALMASMDEHGTLAFAMVAMMIVAFGIGICMPSCLVVVQNAADRRDVGSATGGLLFLRSMGAAVGSTLGGALLATRFAASMASAGVGRTIDMGELRGSADALGGLDAASRALARHAAASGFHLAFAMMAVFTGLAFLACLGMRDLPLQSSEKPTPTMGH